MTEHDAGMDPKRLLAELRIHQAELEAQNEELRRARDAAHQALADYTDLYEFAPVGYATLAPDGTILESNRQLANLLGADRSAIGRRRLQQWIAEADRPRLMQVLAQASDGEPTPACDVEVLRPDGRRRAVAVTATRVAATAAVRVALTDETELRAAERAAQQAKRMEAISRLAGGIAHDLNNLLTVVSVHDDFLLATTPAGSPSREDLEAIHEALQQAASLTERLMAFARPQVFDSRRVPVNALVEAFLPLLRRIVPENVEVTASLGPGAGAVMADPTQLEQLLTHLAVNAADAMPQGGTLCIESEAVEIRADALASEPGVTPGRFVRISAVDGGTGMDTSALTHLFEPYYTTKARGAGLGLATVYAVVRQAGGFVRAESELGVGTRIHMFFPEVAAPEAVAPQAASAATVGGHETILVVEDEPAIRSIVGRMLRRIGYTVHEAADGAEALALLLSLGFAVDLVLTDVVMTGMGGPEFVARLREYRPLMRVVFMTGYASREDMDEAKVPANRGVLHKPFSLEALQRAVRGALDAP